MTNATSDIIAVRGECLAVVRARFSHGPEEPEAFHVDYLQLIEINDDQRLTALIAFDPDDIGAAFRNSTPGTSPAKRPPTRIHGRLSRGGTALSTELKYPR